VYSNPGEGIVLTGVGRYTFANAGTYFAFAARWNDPGYNNPRAHQFDIMRQGYLDGRRGFALHESCWTLLVQAYHPAPVPHERLFDVLRSMPMAMTDDTTMDWGHGYGDLVFLRGETSYFPWEYLRFGSRGSQGRWFGTPYAINPLAFSQVERLLAEPPQTPPSRNPVPTSEASPAGHDPFDMVPEELCCAIAACLPTNDLLNLRLASRSFWSIFDTQQFWASRFRGIRSERSWLYEAAQVLATPGNIQRHDWRWLYRRTTGARIEEWVTNRKRIWDLILPVVDLMDLSWSELPADLPAPWTAPYIPGDPAAPGRSSPGDLWLQASGSLWGRGRWQDITPLQRACAQLKKVRVAIPTDEIVTIAASTVHLGSKLYVAGLTFTTTAGESLTLGYTNGRVGGAFQLHGETLTGFNLAIGLRGIQALQFVSRNHETERFSAWLGYPHNSPKTRRLSNAASGGRMVLEVGFDVRQARHDGLPLMLTMS